MIIEFESWDAALAYLAQQRILAELATKPWQRSVGAGDYCLTIAREADDLIIYNHVQEAPEGPYVFVRAYSVVVPEGEYGDIALPNILRLLTAEQWARAEAASWPNTVDGLAEVIGGSQ